MNNTVIKVENLSKQYRLGLVGTGTLSHDLNRWWSQLRGKEDPYLRIGEVNKRDESVANGVNDYVWALKDINFEVKQGEVLGIIGKNGAGKSTLLKILSRVTGPTTGSFKAKGRIASLLEVGTGFHPELTGKENIYLNGAILGMTKNEIRSKIDEIIDFSGVEKYIDTPVKRYSSGMYVRLAFAVAAHLDPEILIVDEVLAVGDAEFQKKCLGKMKDIAGEGRTVLFVSHNMGAVEKLCNRAMLLEAGRCVYQGNTESAIDEYLDGVNKNVARDTSLNEWPRDQTYGKEIRFCQGWFVDSKGNSINILKSGAKIELHLELKAFMKDYYNVYVNVGINGQQNLRVVTVSSRSVFGYIKIKKNESTILRITLKDLNLVPGNYNVTLIVATRGVPHYDILQHVMNFNIIQAEDGELIPHPQLGGVIECDSDWKVL